MQLDFKQLHFGTCILCIRPWPVFPPTHYTEHGRVNAQLQGGILVLVNNSVVFHIFLTFIVINLERVDVKSNPGYSKVCIKAAKCKLVIKKAFLKVLYPKLTFFCQPLLSPLPSLCIDFHCNKC